MSTDPLLDWVSIPSIGFPRLSPRRERMGFLWDPDGRVELYLVEIAGGPPLRLTHGELPKTPNAPFIWTCDDRFIVFSKDHDGDELHDLFRIDRTTGETTALTRDPTCQRYAISVSPDNRWVLFASDQDLGDANRQLDLWRIPFDGGEAERLAHHRQPVNSWISRNLYSPDGSQVVYAASDQDDPRDTEVFLLRTGSSSPERILSVRKGSREIPVGWSPDGRTVAVESDAAEFSRAGLLDVRTREVRWLGSAGADETPVDFSPDGRSLLVVRTQGVRVRPVVYHLGTGEEEVVPVQLDLTGEAGFLRDGKTVVAVRVDSERPPGIVTWPGPAGTVTEVVSPHYGPVSPTAVVGSEIVRFPSFDGREIEAILYRPRLENGRTRAPAIVEVHGGPTWQFYDGFEGFTQYLVARGCVVLRPNVRGSTGYGRQFRDLNLHDLGGGDLKDVTAAAEFLRGRPFVDPERLAIYGASYGGYLTYAALTWYPKLWRAGVAIAGVTDLKRCYEDENPALQHYDRQLMGTPDANPALYRERSPVFFAENVEAPIMMIHGVHDPRCPVSQARVFRDALVRLGRREGRDFEYLEFSDVGHGSAEREQILRSYRPAFTFLERHLRPESQNATAPQ